MSLNPFLQVKSIKQIQAREELKSAMPQGLNPFLQVKSIKHKDPEAYEEKYLKS